MLHCPMCTGFWVGLLLSWKLGYVITANPFLDGFIASGACYLLRTVFVYACEDCAMNLPEFEKYDKEDPDLEDDEEEEEEYGGRNPFINPKE